MSKKRFNVYGYWRFVDVLSLSCGIEKDDIVYVFSKCGDMVKAYLTSGKIVDFHVTNLTKEYFVRPGRGHSLAECCAKGMFGSDCSKCSTNRQRQLLTRVIEVENDKRV